MSDILSFPDKQKQLLINGKKKLTEKNFLAAKKDFLMLYEREPSYSNCCLVIASMRALGEYKEALHYVEFHLDDFLKKEQGIESYGQLLLLDGQYLAVHRLLKKYPHQEKLREDLEQIETVQHIFSEHTLSEKEAFLLRIDQTNRPIQKKEWQTLIDSVSFADFLAISKDYLPKAKNPFVPPKIIEELVKDGATGDIYFKKQIIDLEKLSLLQDSPALKTAVQVIEQGTKNPQLLELTKAELTGHFALLYPLLPSVDEAKKWGESYLLEFQNLLEEKDTSEELKKYTAIQKKKEKIRQIYQNFL